MSRYKAYPAYRDSGVEWADKLPEQWGTVHLRWISTLYAGGTPSKAIEAYWENGSVPNAVKLIQKHDIKRVCMPDGEWV